MSDPSAIFTTLPNLFHSSIARASNPNAFNRTHPARDRQTNRHPPLACASKAFFLTISQLRSWKTHVPLNAPTGLRTGAATTSIIRCEVWKPRRAAKVEIWAGRAKAALRSAEGMRKAILLFYVLERVCLEESGLVGVLFVRLFAMLGFGRVRVETGCLMELGWSAPRCDGGPEA